MQIRIHADRRVLAGTPIEIVMQMKDLAFAAEGLSLDEYTTWAAQMARDMMGVTLKLEGEGDARATSLLRAMLEAGLAEEVLPEN